MHLLPYKKIKLESTKSLAEISSSLRKVTSEPEWRIDLLKFAENKIFEASVKGDEFTILRGRYGLTWGITSLLPVMKGKINEDKTSNACSIVIVIRPLFWGIFIWLLFLVLCIFILTVAIQKGSTSSILVCTALLVVTSYSVISKFNESLRFYRQLIDEVF